MLVVLAVALIGMVFSGGLPGTTTPPAKALFDDLLCLYQNPDDYVPSPEPWPGAIGGLGLMTRDIAYVGGTAATNTGPWDLQDTATDITDTLRKYVKPYKGWQTATGYEWYGTAGLQWKIEQYKDLGAQCPPFAALAGNQIANLVNQFGQVIGEIGLTIFGWAMSIDAISPFLGSIDAVLKSLKDALFLQYLTPIVLLGALWMMWVGLVKRRSSEAVQGAVWMIGASAAALAFLSNPGWFAGWANDKVTTVSTEIVNAAINTTAGVQGTDLCGIGNSKASWRVSQCQIWETFMLSPWAAGTFGPLAGANLQVAGDWDGNSTAVEIPGKNPTLSMNLVYLDSQTYNHDQVIQSLYGLGVGLWPDLIKPDGPVTKTKIAQWHVVYDAVNEGDAYAARGAFTGTDWGSRLSIAFVNIIAMFTGAIPILFLAFTLVIMQLGTVFLIIASPLFLTIGIHPGFGRRIALGWLEMLMSLTIKRIGTAALLAVLLAVFQAILRSTDSWIAQTMLISAASIGMLVYRKRILDQLSRINLGGGGNLQGGGGRMGRRAAGMATGAAASGASAAVTGGGGGGGRAGSFLVGAALGSMMGRGGSPLAAARMGATRGAAIGRRRSRKGSSDSDSSDPLDAADTVKKERKASYDEDRAMDTLVGDGNKTVEEQADIWTARWRKTGRAVPMPMGSEALLDELERRGVPLRDRVQDRVRPQADRVADALNEGEAAAQAHVQAVVDVSRETTTETRDATVEVNTERTTVPSDGAPGSRGNPVPPPIVLPPRGRGAGDSAPRPPESEVDLARQTLQRHIAAQRAREAREREERERQGEDRQTRDVTPGSDRPTRPPGGGDGSTRPQRPDTST